MLKLRFGLGLVLGAMALSGCAPQVKRLQPALIMPRPTVQTVNAGAETAPENAPPSAGGDILAGSSPADLEAKRIEATRVLEKSLEPPK